MLIHPRRISLQALPNISIEENELLPRPSLRNLGIHMDTILSVDSQICMLCKSLAYQIRLISGIKRFLDDESLRTIVAAAFTSRLDYCNSILVNAPAYHIERLQRLQNTAARLVTRTGRFNHITPVLLSLHWLPVLYRIKYEIALIVFKALNNLAPVYIKELVELHRPARQLRSSSDVAKLKPVRSRTKSYGDRRFSVAAPMVWNELPVDVRVTSSLTSFKRTLKTFYFHTAYESLL